MTSACAGPTPQSAVSPAPTPVPAGCQLSGTPITWGPRQTTPILTDATLVRQEELIGSSAGRKLLDQPFTPTITGVAAPASWLTDLAKSLKTATGQAVHTTSPSPDSQRFGVSSGGDAGQQVHIIIYSGVDRVSAGFTVQCDPLVEGTFVGWSSAVVGGVACQYQPDLAYDAFARLALKYCPDPVTAPPSSAAVDD
ncbi:hypothetical protein KRM28CT15_61440 [Krasilnikovia sp. M28-CT-15]